MSKPIYYLVSVSNNSEPEEYIMGISFDKKILEDMINNNHKPNEDYKLIIRENLKIFQICLDYDKEKLCNKYHIMWIGYPYKSHNYSKLYAFNRIKKINNGLDYLIENIIVDLSVFYDKIDEIELFKDNNISANPILFDTYYEEGVMNA
jgi:hypothetical protein